MSRGPGRLVVVRHGETEWSLTQRHTGRTDIALTSAGEERARGIGQRLVALVPDLDIGLVLASPLVRARRTAELAGQAPAICHDLVEWDYGVSEGRSTSDIRRDLDDPTWSVWTTTQGLGESVQDVADRAARVIALSASTRESGADVLLVAHAHVLRILAAVWLSLPAARGASFVLAPAGIGILADERETPVVAGWNW